MIELEVGECLAKSQPLKTTDGSFHILPVNCMWRRWPDSGEQTGRKSKGPVLTTKKMILRRRRGQAVVNKLGERARDPGLMKKILWVDIIKRSDECLRRADWKKDQGTSFEEEYDDMGLSARAGVTNQKFGYSELPHEPRPKKARQVRSNVKVLLTVFFDCRGVVHHEFLPQGRTGKTRAKPGTSASKEYYLQVMRNLRKAIRQKRPDLWKNKNWLLHHDNAPAHTSLLVRDFLAKNNTLMMPQRPYSPDLAPCDFFLFPKLRGP
ncbi:hypothetical protein LAZ67_15002534 [Cordylochernes scorpioides]|uniref:Mariner Mos1 transposase n=1 Tax=Cordylochernes scorpioides TaxID=51811 RepID=A0ABY6LEE2_9ARAC|nr:hypothetical protein LAZ67_15002534 [Cordylochernes scorpioides]